MDITKMKGILFGSIGIGQILKQRDEPAAASCLPLNQQSNIWSTQDNRF